LTYMPWECYKKKLFTFAADLLLCCFLFVFATQDALKGRLILRVHKQV